MENLNEMNGGSATADSLILNKETATRLNSMLNSTDPEDHKMAREILNKIKIRESIYWIWQLAIPHSNRMVNLRTKASREFKDKCNLFGIAYSNSTEFGVWLNQKGWLNNELFMLLKGNIVNGASKVNQNPFYNFHITIKDKYKELDPEDSITKLNHD